MPSNTGEQQVNMFEYGNVRIHHNGDYNGKVIIAAPSSYDSSGMCRYDCASIEIPSAVLFRFVAEAIRQHRISKIENESVGELLGLPEILCK